MDLRLNLSWMNPLLRQLGPQLSAPMKQSIFRTFLRGGLGYYLQLVFYLFPGGIYCYAAPPNQNPW